MALQQSNALSRAASGDLSPTPRSGVVHVNIRHTSHYTVIGNHLAQHRTLTLTAIGLAVYIQSLPTGARIGVKCLAARFPEGEARIASALRELEACGYLKRTRERLPTGRIVTRTLSYNHPGARVPAPPTRNDPNHRRPTANTERERPVPTPDVHPARPAAAQCTARTSTTPAPPPERVTSSPVLPAPRTSDPARQRAATALLAALRHDDVRLLLSEHDVDRLTPAVAAWLERGVRTEAVRSALTRNLPDILRSPAALLGHRLAALIPPQLPAAPDAPGSPSRSPHPLQTCDDCDRAFRAPEPGRCRDCRIGGR